MPLENELKYHLEALLRESCQFNANDVLVHIDPASAKIFVPSSSSELEFREFPSVLLREAEKSQKESGINSLCRVLGSISIPVGGRFVDSPIWLVPLTHTYNKLQQIHRLEEDSESAFLNPYVRIQLEQTGASKLDDFSFEDLQGYLQERSLNFEPDFHCIGNFHHHRYQVIRELEELLALPALGVNVSQLLGFSNDEPSFSIPVERGQLFASDLDHEAVFTALTVGNTVVQGPPGTGKSQVLTNCVAKNLAAGKRVIVVSEKRAALEVIQKKLGFFGLDKLCYIATSDHLSHHFLQELKAVWDHFEQLELSPRKNLRLSEQHHNSLQMTLDLLAQEELIGGVSFHTFQALCGEKQLQDYTYHSDALTVRYLVDHQQQLELLYSKSLPTVLGRLLPEVLKREKLIHFDRSLREWIDDLKTLKQHFSIEKFPDLEKAMRKAALCQVYENELFKQYAPLFTIGSRQRKKFLKLRKQYQSLNATLEAETSNTSHWTITPSSTECEGLLKMLENGNLFARRKVRKRWRQMSPLAFDQAVALLQKQVEIGRKKQDLSKLLIEFYELGVDSPDQFVEVIYRALHVYTEEQWLDLEAIPSAERLELTAQHTGLNRLYTALRIHLNLRPTDPLEETLTLLLDRLPDLLTHRDLIEDLDGKTLRALGRNEDFQHLKGEILRSHQVLFAERFPAFSTFKIQDIYQKVQAVIAAEKEEFEHFAAEIEWKSKERFAAYHQLLTAATRKLSDEEKSLKARLRKGKALLVKEFGKSRSHPSLRELYSSDARLWIQVLKPIWLSNPVQLANCFPMESNLFDLAIFDEASQIPVQNALGTLQRANRALIAGDEHQMGPSNYFKAGPTEAIDLLHQAAYNWNKVTLKHHYRSAHPDLIRFSNQHFYGNELVAYPAAQAAPPIHWHFVENGSFIERKNTKEATQVAQLLETLHKQSNQIGVVAFSEEQLTAIRAALPPALHEILSAPDYPGFFKTLENVQGDECEHLVISFGYAPNEEGDFALRFGPMNTSNGRKRMNVLLTRAQLSLHFFSSVRSSDFGMSDNESVNLLKNWLNFAEHYAPQEDQLFPQGLKPTIQGNQLIFPHIQVQLPQAKEVVNLQRVLEGRGWAVSYS